MNVIVAAVFWVMLLVTLVENFAYYWQHGKWVGLTWYTAFMGLVVYLFIAYGTA